jgi:hypothetical protein
MQKWGKVHEWGWRGDIIARMNKLSQLTRSWWFWVVAITVLALAVWWGSELAVYEISS